MPCCCTTGHVCSLPPHGPVAPVIHSHPQPYPSRCTMRLLTLAACVILADAEMMFANTPCPAAVPRELCFGGAMHVDWTSPELPLSPTLSYVRDLLQDALKVEHSVIPLYLTTLYSIKDQTSFAAATIHGVAIEEMLHMVNVANVLNAVGGEPFIDHPDFVPKYPLVMPLINVDASITWFTRGSVGHYQMLESTPPGGYNSSISAAYLHIVQLLTSLCRQHGEAAVFTGNQSLQV